MYRVLTDMQLEIALPMVLEIDNSGAVDIFNNWASTGHTCHMDVHYKFLRELKESVLIKIIWCSGLENESDIFTKSCAGPLFSKSHRDLIQKTGPGRSVALTCSVFKSSFLVRSGIQIHRRHGSTDDPLRVLWWPDQSPQSGHRAAPSVIRL